MKYEDWCKRRSQRYEPKILFDMNCEGHLWLTRTQSVSVLPRFHIMSLQAHYGRAILLTFAVLSGAAFAGRLFSKGKEYTYSYDASTSSSTLLPAEAASSWGLNGKLVIIADEDSVLVQLQSIKMSASNGPPGIEKDFVKIDEQAEELLKPFRIDYDMGYIQNFSVGTESPWATNIKRSIAGILQLDLKAVEKKVAFYSQEINHYGQCNIECVVIPITEDESVVTKSFDPRTCRGHPQKYWSNVPRMECPNNDQNPVLKSSERLYKVRAKGEDYTILFVNATGGIYVQPFQSLGEAHVLFTRQILELTSVRDVNTRISKTDLQAAGLEHELPEGDLTQGRSVPDKITIFATIRNLLDRLSQRLENPGLDTKIDNLHNTTISILLYYLNMLERADLQTVYNKISGTSYKEETIRNMLLEILPQVGSKESALFVLDLILQKKVSHINAIQLLTHLPFHVKNPNVELLVNMQSLLNLPDYIAPDIQNTGILTFGTLIYKTCQMYCPYEMLDDYVRLYLDKFTESTQYEKKMVYLEGLANIQLGRVVEFLEPIASGGNSESRHLRFLAAWSSLPSAPYRPDVIYPVYWPILVNRTEHLEMRIAAMTLLIVSNPSPSRLISLYWYMQGEPNQHLYNFFYTTLKSMERTNYPCYTHIGNIAAQFIRILRKPPTQQKILTGNYLFDYQDTSRHFGAMLHGIVIADSVTNIPTVLHLTLNNHGIGTNLNHVSLYIKAEGLLYSLSTYQDSPTRLKDILKQFMRHQEVDHPVHLEIIARVQQKAVLCLHLNQTNIVKAFKFLVSLPGNAYHIYQNMEFHINQQRINVPLTIESVQATDLGTNVRIAATATSLFSMRGNFTHVFTGRNNHVVLRTSIHGTQTIETYNPLTDLWHGAERTQSFHAYLPFNITIGLDEKFFVSYMTPKEYVKTGITGHVRVVTNIRGAKVKSKLQAICPSCPVLYTVRKYAPEESTNVTIFGTKAPELGGQLHVKIFDCENDIFQSNVVVDMLSSHRGNSRIWPVAQSALLGLHLIDYFTYIPPKGSCGVEVYIEPYDLQSTEVRFEYVKSEKYHMFSIIRRELETKSIFQQWNVAVLYEPTSMISDVIKIKASKTIPGEKVMKVCVQCDREIPWDWEYLSLTSTEPSSMKINIVWGPSDTAKGKCTGTKILLNLRGEVTNKQVKQSLEDKWPYNKCREESRGKQFVPYTEACYQASKELSTLRKYEIFTEYENVPTILISAAWKFRSFYNFIGGNTSTSQASDQFSIVATFPTDSNTGQLQYNMDTVPIFYSSPFISFFFTRSRLHKYTDNPLLGPFIDVCVLKPSTVQTVHNISVPLRRDREAMILGHSYEDNPKFVVTAVNTPSGIILNLHDDTDDIKIMPQKNGGAVYNYTSELPLKRDFEFHTINSKSLRLDGKTVDVMFVNLVFIHWTQEQVFLFFPNYIRGFTCGVCTAHDFDTAISYEKL
ncbi:vitellogenin-3 [Orussus abietinus]|uniref:vitellogenin-3 n=1 Tax=Orussus abietinus TaxID=222816 RepID=UPI000C715C1D|nr:vitellogenin-3 [Orussus abietinus]